MNQSTTAIESNQKKLWALWKTYLWRWLLFGFIGAALQPVTENLDTFWLKKLNQALSGLPFGFVCFAVFTPLQNAVNTPRVRWKSWLTAIGTWMGVKFLFVGVMIALGFS